MGESYEEILKGLEPERIEIINECISNMQDKSEKEVIGIIGEAAKKFMAAGRPMSTDERKVLIYAMRDNLPTDQKKKFDIILNMIGIN